MVTHLVGLVTSLKRSPGDGGHSYKISSNGLPVVYRVYDLHPRTLKTISGVSKDTVQVGTTFFQAFFIVLLSTLPAD